MKKVLTLMGALSVAGSAIAHDYLWNMSDLSVDSWAKEVNYNGKFTYFGDANSRLDVKGVVSSVAGSQGKYSFKFNVEAGDSIIVHAYNLNSEAAKVYFKAANEESKEIATEDVLTVTADEAAAGEVYVYADANVAITKITVVSAKYRAVVDKLAKVRAAIDEKKKGIAKYVTDYPKFYTAVTRQISEKVSNGILSIEEMLAKDAAEDRVSGANGTGGGLIDDLDLLKGILDDIIDAADAAVAAYKGDGFLGSDEYKAADAAIDKAYDKSGADVYSMYNAEGELKAEGLKAYMDSKVKAVFEAAKAGAKAELDNFPWKDEDGNYGTYPADTHKAKVVGLEQLVKNIIDRYVYEKDNATKFASLKTLVASVANDITSTGLEAPATFEGLKTNIEDLCEELNKADNKETYTKAEIEDEDDGFEHLYSQYSIELGAVTDVASGASVMSQLTKTAYESLVAKVEEVQKNLTNYSAKITEQYTGQKDVQAKYEKIFAELQVSLDNVLKDKTTYKDLVCGYNSLVEALDSIKEEIIGTWTNSQDAKTAELRNQNRDAWNRLQGEITSALKDYAEAVNRINGYKEIPGAEDAKDDIEAALVKVFEYANEIETIKTNAATEYDNVADGSDSFKYQTYKNALDEASDNILKETQSARGLANKAAFDYLTTDDDSEGTLAYANDMWNSYRNNSFYYDQNIQDLATEQYDNLKVQYIDKAQTIIDGYWDVNDQEGCEIADHVNEIEELLKPLYTGDGENPSELDKVSNKVNAYNGLAGQIPGLKSEWSVAKANVDSDNADDIEELLSTISVSITTLEKAIQDWGLGAQDHVDDVNAEIAKIKGQLWKAINYKKSIANDIALKAINEAIDKVKDELTAAKDEVAELVSHEVVEEYNGKLDAVSFVAVEDSRDAHYASHDLDDETVKSRIIDVDLKVISDAIAQIVEDAKAADKAAQEVPGDVNGDKALDALDFEIIEEFVVNGASEDETEDIKAMREQSDLNNDGKVDTRDLNEFLKLYRNK